MEKPLTVAREEFVEDLINLVNKSNLPMFIILDVLKSAVSEVQDAAKIQYEKEKKLYEEAKKIKEKTVQDVFDTFTVEEDENNVGQNSN